MLFVESDGMPSEDKQFEVYEQAARAAAGQPVLIRTLDIGGDKPLPYLNLPREVNPFLGSRGARLYADHEDLMREQFRAIARASAFGSVQMLLPMVSSLAEVRWANAMLCYDEFQSMGFRFPRGEGKRSRRVPLLGVFPLIFGKSLSVDHPIVESFERDPAWRGVCKYWLRAATTRPSFTQDWPAGFEGSLAIGHH